MTRVRTEVVLAGIFAVLAVATAFWPTWIESLFDESPDAGSGALEWAIVGVFGLLAITAAVLARRDYRAIRRTSGVPPVVPEDTMFGFSVRVTARPGAARLVILGAVRRMHC